MLRSIACFTSLASLFLVGCATHSTFHVAQSPPSEEVVHATPHPARQRVHLIFVNGLDFFDFAHFRKLPEAMAKQGFEKVHLGEFHHGKSLGREMLQLVEHEPDTRFVLVGYGYGAETVSALVRFAAERRIVVETVIYLEPRGTPEVDALHGAPVGRRLLVRSEGKDASRWTNSTDEEYRVPTNEPWEVPQHTATVDLLLREANRVASTVPVYLRSTGVMSTLLDQPAPPPRP